jgi:hypothetical protein
MEINAKREEGRGKREEVRGERGEVRGEREEGRGNCRLICEVYVAFKVVIKLPNLNLNILQFSA